MTDGVVMLPSYYEAINTLPDVDRLKMYDAIMKYGFHGESEELPPHLQGFFSLIKPTIDSSQRRYRAAKENGSKGGAPLGNQNARKNNRKTTRKQPNIQPKINQDIDSDSDNDIDSDTDTDSDSDFPTLAEVQKYCEEIGSNSNPDAFFEYYNSHHWMTGNEPVKDWKALFRSWKPRQTASTPKRETGINTALLSKIQETIKNG